MEFSLQAALNPSQAKARTPNQEPTNSCVSGLEHNLQAALSP